jgi:hypothetical protein
MISNYTVPALAAGLRDREETLQLCARLLANGDLEQLERVLHPYQAGLITRRRRKTRSLDLAGGLTSKHLNMLRKYLQRSPRQAAGSSAGGPGLHAPEKAAGGFAAGAVACGSG